MRFSHIKDSRPVFFGALIILLISVVGGASRAEAVSLAYICSSACPAAAGVTMSSSLDKSVYSPGDPIVMTTNIITDDNPQSGSPNVVASVNGGAYSADLFPGIYSPYSSMNGASASMVIGYAPATSGTYTVTISYGLSGYTSASGSITFTVSSPSVAGVCAMNPPPTGGSGNYPVNGCSTGTLGANAVQSDGSYQWYCNGANGGATSPLCWYSPPPSPVAGVCATNPPPTGGSGNYPINGCSSGTLGANGAQSDGSYQWYCNGANGGATSPLCWYAPPPVVNGTCSAMGSNGNSPINGCSTGTLGANAVQPDGSYQWYCNGANGGATSPLCWNSSTASPPAPVASISASPTSVASGGQSTLSWGSTNATSCTASGPWSNSGTLSGSGWTNALSSDTTFYFQCTGPGGTSPMASVTVTIGASASSCPTTTIYGCSLSNVSSGGSSGSCASGYTGSCNYSCSNGTWSQNSNSCTASTLVTAALTASPTSIIAGQSSTLTWSSTNAYLCTAAGGFSTSNATAGSVSVSPSITSTYSVTCTGFSGISAPANATVTVIVPTPTLSITAIPSRVLVGGSTTVTWNASNVSGCFITRNGASWKTLAANASNVVSGSSPDTITGQTTYVLSCNDRSGVAVAKTVAAIVNVAAAFQEF